jgi:hypothetical protein
MNSLLLMLLFSIAGTWFAGPDRGKGPFDFNAQIGVVTLTPDKEILLHIKNPGLTTGTRVTVVVLDAAQSTTEAVIDSKGDEGGFDSNLDGESHYLLKLTKGEPGFTTPALGVAGTSAQFKLMSTQVTADLDGDGRREFFRECSSTEGLHMTVWSGSPISGQLRWHRYHYLGYALEPNCTNKEVEEQ